MKSHEHDHNHGSHGHHGHNHAHGSSHRVLMVAIAIILGFSLVEGFGGWWAGSLALLGDAGHMASDAISLAIAAFAAWLTLRPPSSKHSYGLGRAEVIAAWISSLLLLAISVFVIVEAIHRLQEPIHVKGGPVMLIAAFGVIANLFVAWILARGERTLNIRAALLHVIGDLLGSFAALVAGAVIYFTGWLPIDPILSIFIGVLIMLASIRLLRESMRILMEGVPHHVNFKQVSHTMSQLKGVKAIHDLHIWTLSSGSIALSAHVDIQDLTTWEKILIDLKNALKQEYQIEHVTLQPEPSLMDCEPCSNS